MKTKVYKIEVFVIDYNREGIDQIISSIEDSGEDFPAKVGLVKEVNIDWSDDHPLNLLSASKSEYERLFLT